MFSVGIMVTAVETETKVKVKMATEMVTQILLYRKVSIYEGMIPPK